MTFQNYQQSIELYTSQQENVFNSNVGLQLYLNQKIVVQINKQHKYQLDRVEGVIKIQVLAELGDEIIVLVTPSIDAFIQTYNRIDNLPYTGTVQPDFAIVRKTQQPAKNRHREIQNNQFERLKGFQCRSSVKPKRIAIIDDGFDLSQPWLSAFDVMLEYDADNQRIIPHKEKAGASHGNVVAGVIATQLQSRLEKNSTGIAELVAIHQASTLNSAMILAFSVSQKMHVDIINSSWTLPLASQVLGNVIRYGLSHSGISFVVVSAGNHAQDACIGNRLSEIEGVTTVGALSEGGSLAAFSNYGKCVDLYAPAAFLLKKQTVNIAVRGTSSAAAMVTGEISYLLGCGLSSSEIGLKNQN
ncbi:S8 family peptidase [Pseudoalteromonas luteoviolacea]|uniref:S8 family peptidase n=1 Tax=Pseudoalteromonas luteoviolacea TaxID=43657 RepID=UPI0018C86EC6|nr:S8/S53 family peptidase [Pseudoalteromonas luteoviolacea]